MTGLKIHPSPLTPTCTHAVGVPVAASTRAFSLWPGKGEELFVEEGEGYTPRLPPLQPLQPTTPQGWEKETFRQHVGQIAG